MQNSDLYDVDNLKGNVIIQKVEILAFAEIYIHINMRAKITHVQKIVFQISIIENNLRYRH